MPPLLASTQPAHIHVSVAARCPPMPPLLPSTHACLRCCPASIAQPLGLSCTNAAAFPGLRIPRVVLLPYKRDMLAGVSLHYFIGNQEPGRRRKGKHIICQGRGPDVHAQGCHTTFRSPLTLIENYPKALKKVPLKGLRQKEAKGTTVNLTIPCGVSLGIPQDS